MWPDDRSDAMPEIIHRPGRGGIERGNLEDRVKEVGRLRGNISLKVKLWLPPPPALTFNRCFTGESGLAGSFSDIFLHLSEENILLGQAAQVFTACCRF